MPYLETLNGLAAELQSIGNTGPIILEDKHIRDKKRLATLFTEPGMGSRERIRGWRIHRQDVTEEWYSTLRTRAFERYILRGLEAVEERANSEAEFQNMVDAVLAHFRGVKRVAGIEMISAGLVDDVTHVTIGGRLCHYAEIAIIAEELYTIAVPSPGAPSHHRSGASSMAEYEDTADQIAAYIASLDDSGMVWPERRYAATEHDLKTLFMTPDTDMGPGRYVVRTWQVYRANEEEIRGLGNRVVSEAIWKIQGSRGWSDSHETAIAFQLHIDEVRELFRGVGNFGNPFNPTQTHNEPLQVVEIDARMLGDYLVHFADCELSVSELAHA